MSRTLPVGTVTFVFTDIEGSTRLLQVLGDRYARVLDRHAEIVREALGAHGGVEVSTEGDSFFAVFVSAVDAVRAVVDVQRALAAERWPDGTWLRVRIGLHTGAGRLGGDGYVGLDVHRAARIAAAGHGGQVLLSASARALVEHALPDGVVLRDAGSHHLKDLDRPEQLAQLTIDGVDQPALPPRSLDAASSLPGHMTDFIGREREIDAARARLRGTRLLTLTGPGGTGKTRLATRLGELVRAEFADGVHFVDLAPLADPALVGSTIARALGLTERPERPVVDALKAYLEPRSLLLILDNFEHLLAAADLVGDLLAAAPQIRVLATSRARLRLYGEQELPVPPLSVPDPGTGDLGEMAANEAVALFLDRARASDPGFGLTAENASTVAQICIRLEGLPLAIELAASRVRLFEPSELLARLDRRLPLLAGGATNVPARQRTVRNAIAWSYELLDPVLRRLLSRLSIFAGGWDVAAAEAVADPDAELGIDIVDGLAALVDQSLVARRAASGASRFGMLEVVREFAAEQLDRDGERPAMARRHLEHFRRLAETAEPKLRGPEEVAWLDRLEQESDNVRAALRCAIEDGAVEDGLRLAGALWRYWQQRERGSLREGRAWLETLLRLEPERVDRHRAKALTALGGLAYWLGDDRATEDAYERAVSAWRSLGDREAEAEALYNVAFVPLMRGDHAEAGMRFERSLAVAMAVGRMDLVALSRRTLGTILALDDDRRRDETLLGEALEYFRSVGDRLQTAWTLGELGVARRAAGDLRGARAAFVEALGLHWEAKDLPGIAATIAWVAALDLYAGDHAEAMRLLGAARELEERTGASTPSLFTVPADLEDVARSAIGDASVVRALAEGRAMPLADAVAEATREVRRDS